MIKKRIREVNDEVWFRGLTKFRYSIQTLRYEFVAHPYKILEIKPNKIECQAKVGNKWDGLGQIKGGNWEYRVIEDKHQYEGLRQRFVDGLDWKDTVYIETARKKIQENGSYAGYGSVDDVLEKRCRYLDSVFKDMKNEGYKPNFNNSVSFPAPDYRNEQFIHELEPMVVIDSDGTFHLRDGFHRYTMAEILGENLFVYVVVRHPTWQQHRDALCKGKKQPIKTDRSHPDLQDIVVGEESVVEP